MAPVCTLIHRLVRFSMAAMLLVLAIYWFELDDKFLKAFEPTFRKLADRVKGRG